MTPFVLFAVCFALGLTLLVRVLRLPVRRPIDRARATLLTAAFVGLALLAWWAATRGARIEDRWVAPLILPSPVEVLAAFPRLHFEQELVRSIGISFVRVTVGFALAVWVALPLGVYMAAFPAVSAFFRPLALVGAYVPIVVFVPLTLVWFGMTEMQKVGFLFIGCLVALLPQVIKSIEAVAPAYVEVATTKGASQWQIVRHVLVPVAMADIWDHLRAVYGVGWGWIILAEVVNGTRGLGYLISLSERRGHTAAMFAVIIVIVLIAIASDQVWRLGGNLLFPYRARK
jgi:NitT/TauT family transport system permease protein